ncbi:MAG: GNAT family N-acetyltransferase [Bacteroidales bacterium]|nr:GNAT family N-acetyltransferase [Bacteroidales bacterium]
MLYRIQNSCEGIDFKEVVAIIKSVGMKYHDPVVQERAFRNSTSTIFIFDKETLVGFGRAISDGVSQAAIYDVAIEPSYQGKGLGKMVIQTIREELPGFNLILYASPGKEDFYRKNGFFKMRTAMAYFEDAESRRAKGFIE